MLRSESLSHLDHHQLDGSRTVSAIAPESTGWTSPSQHEEQTGHTPLSAAHLEQQERDTRSPSSFLQSQSPSIQSQHSAMKLDTSSQNDTRRGRTTWFQK